MSFRVVLVLISVAEEIKKVLRHLRGADIVFFPPHVDTQFALNQALEHPLTRRLLDSGDISSSTATAAIESASNIDLVNSLLRAEQVSDVRLSSAIAEVFDLEELKPQNLPLQAESRFVPLVDFLFQQEALPLFESSGVLRVAMSNPFNEMAIKTLQSKLTVTVQPVVAARSQILTKLSELYKRVERDSRSNQKIFSYATTAQQSSPLIAEINAVLHGAVEMGASDVHIEPNAQGLRARLRIDGLLHSKHQFSEAVSEQVISRIKLMAKMDVAERRFAQDGRFSFQSQGKSVDVRVSSLPLAHRESVVLRLLDQEMGARSLDELGLTAGLVKRLTYLSSKQAGILLVTGPTGSGKSTTLYSLMQGLNVPTRKLVSIENPVEMRMPGVNQIQIDEEYGIGFANSLRAVLRQDPDVILVGEIRDEETARLAIQASLTGHLVLSTLHTSSAIGSIQRLRDLGVKDSMIRATLVGVVAQRLLRLRCVDCTQGCPMCSQTGYRHRSAVAELMELKSTDVLPNGPDESYGADWLFQGYSMLDAARDLVERGLTTTAEITRVFGIASNER